MKDTTQTLLRSVLKIGAGYALAKGLVSHETMQTALSAAAALAGVFWGVKHRTPGARSVTVKHAGK